jgi:hypothetical protein
MKLRGASIVFSGAALALVIACEVIVPADVPDFSCGSVAVEACPSGMVCDLTSGKCVPPSSGDDTDGGDDGPDADGNTKPDAKDGEAGGLLAIGEGCKFDADCASKLCGTSTILTTTFTGAGPICTKSCCTSADCPSTFVCFSGGTGGSYCVPAGKAQRSPPASGGSTPGTTCGVPSECRSGLCSNSRCVDTCCLTTDCAVGTVCAVATVTSPAPGHDQWVCIPPIGAKNPGTACIDNVECKVNNCVGQNSSICTKCPVCTPSCCKASDCSPWATAAAVTNGATCAYGLSGSDQLKWCFPIDPARAPIETTCSSNFDCQSAFCDPETKKCAAVCCTDADCGFGNICSPSAVNTPYLRCVPGKR